MSWVDGLLLAAMVIGVLAGGYSFARNPKSYLELGKALFDAILPVLAKRNTPEVEAAQKKAKLEGLEWDNFRKKPRDR